MNTPQSLKANQQTRDYTPAYIFVFSFILRAAAALHGSPYCYHNDEHWLFKPAFKMVLSGSWDPGWYHYPPLVTLIYRAIIPILQKISPINLVIPTDNWMNPEHILPYQFPVLYVGRLISVFFASATIALLYLLLKRLANKQTALLFSFLFSIFQINIFYTSFLRPEPTMIFFQFFSFYCLCNFGFDKSKKWIYLAGLSIGLSIGAKYNAMYFLLTACLMILFFGFQKREAILNCIKFGISTIVGFVIANPFILINFKEVTNQVNDEYNYYKNGGLFDSRSHLENLYYYLGNLYSKDKLYILFFIAALSPIYLLIRKSKIELNKKIILWSSLFFISTYILLLCQFMVGVERNIIVLYPYFFLIAGCIVYEIVQIKNIKLDLVIFFFLAWAFIPATVNYIHSCSKSFPQDHARQWIYENVPKKSMILREFETPFVSPKDFRSVYITSLAGLTPYWIYTVNPNYIMLSKYMSNRLELSNNDYAKKLYQWAWSKNPEFEDKNPEGLAFGIHVRILDFRKYKDDFMKTFPEYSTLPGPGL